MSDPHSPAVALPTERRTAYVHLSHGQSAARNAKLYDMGMAADRVPYGFNLAEAYGYDLIYSVDRPMGRVPSLIRRVAKKALGFDLVHAFQNRKSVEHVDVVWTMLEVEALALAGLMALGLVPRKPMLGSTVWMINRWNSYGWPRKALYKYLISYFSKVLVHAQPCLSVGQAIFARSDVCLLPFGVSADTFRTETGQAVETEVIHIFAAGNDHTRDWNVLIVAFGNDPRFRLTILCPWIDRDLERQYDNLTIPADLDGRPIKDALSIYRTATYIAVPMHENLFSGITVALEAASMSIPVISTRTGGVPTYFADDEVRYVPVGDSVQWRNAALEQSASDRSEMARRAHRRSVSSGYSTQQMMKRYVDHTEELLSNQKS